MSLFTKVGNEVTQDIAREKIDIKTAYIRLKNEGESIPVRILGVADFVGYKAHSNFKKNLYNTPCLAVQGEYCPYCEISKTGGEDWNDFYAKDRYIFAFADLQAEKTRVLEVSKNQAKKLIAQIEEYKEEIMDGEIAFNLTRSGTGTATMYLLNMMTSKKMAAIQSKFDKFENETIDIDFFESRLPIKTETYMLNLLEDAGVVLGEHFQEDLIQRAEDEKERIMNKQNNKIQNEEGLAID